VPTYGHTVPYGHTGYGATSIGLPGSYGHSGTFGYGHTPYGHGFPPPLPVVAEVMAYGRKHRHGEQWGMCMVCGFMYPYSQLRIQPGDRGGHVVCLTMCLDEPSVLDLLPDELPMEQPLLFIEEGGPSS
jgi:hypothetical protein